VASRADAADHGGPRGSRKTAPEIPTGAVTTAMSSPAAKPPSSVDHCTGTHPIRRSSGDRVPLRVPAVGPDESESYPVPAS
jgi:hypothetical protein